MQPRGLHYGVLKAQTALISQEKPKQVVRAGKDVTIYQVHRREVEWRDRSKHTGAHLRQLRAQRAPCFCRETDGLTGPHNALFSNDL